jgi:hypothetical protein
MPPFPLLQVFLKKGYKNCKTTGIFSYVMPIFIFKKINKHPIQLRKATSKASRTQRSYALTLKNEAAPVPDKFLFSRRGGPSFTAR